MKTTIQASDIHALGLGLTDTQEAELVKQLQSVLEQRIAVAIMELLDENRGNELKQLAEGNDPAAVGKWIEAHLPEYQNIVDDEYDILIGDVIKDPMQFTR